MNSQHPGVTGRASTSGLEPLAVSPCQASLLLGIGTDAPQPRRRGRPRKHTDAAVTP